MENDNWQRLGDVVARIVARTEQVIADRPPVATEDAALFVKMLAEVYGPSLPEASRRSEGQAE